MNMWCESLQNNELFLELTRTVALGQGRPHIKDHMRSSSDYETMYYEKKESLKMC